MLFDSDVESNSSRCFDWWEKSEIVRHFYYYHEVIHALRDDQSITTSMECYELEGNVNKKIK